MANPKLEEMLSLAQTLSPLDKVRLVEQIMATLEQDLSLNQPKRALYGLWADINLSESEIDEARQEIWGNFPREDI